MNLSSVMEGQAGIILKRPNKGYNHTVGKRFVVVDRVPEDRSSGLTTVRYEDGHAEEFIWDCEDPEVRIIGTGKVEIKVVIHEDGHK